MTGIVYNDSDWCVFPVLFFFARGLWRLINTILVVGHTHTSLSHWMANSYYSVDYQDNSKKKQQV